ncbi:MAG: ABC transporter permease [Lentimicrobium sp.]|jgi:putative ABC transport system permease protein|nr:ABC transporter permease [Lentimicrobium sp.]
MWLNFFKTASRSLLRQRAYTLINLAGLSVGFAAFILIFLFVRREVSFDRHIEKHQRIFRIVEIQNEPGVGEQHVAITMGPLAAALKRDFPQITATMRLMNAWSYSTVTINDQVFRENSMYFADPSIISMYGIVLLSGNPQTVLADPHSLLLSESVAVKYFGSPGAANGRSLQLGGQTFRVAGVMKDQPQTSHLFFNILLPFSVVERNPDFEWLKGWGSNSLITYVELDNPASAQEVNDRLDDFLQRHVMADGKSWQYLEMYLQPLDEIYLHSAHIKFQDVTHSGNAGIITIFIVVAFLILLIACVNFVNISIARSVKRFREVGMRKVLGAGRRSLILQYISESAIVTFISVIISLGLIQLVLPEMNALLGTDFELKSVFTPGFTLLLCMLFIIISLISGAYPAFYLSGMQPVDVFRGLPGAKRGRSALLSKLLVTFQFTISIALIFCVIVISQQINFIRHKDLGISYRDAVFVRLERDNTLKMNTLKTMLLSNPEISSVAASTNINGVSGSQGPAFVDDSARTKIYVRYGYVDPEFFNTMKIPVIAGNNFDPSLSNHQGVIINQAAVRALGWDQPIGKRFRFEMEDSVRIAPVIGVVKDYHYYSLRSPIEPALWAWLPGELSGLVIKYRHPESPDKKENLMKFIENSVKTIFPSTPYTSSAGTTFAWDSYQSDEVTYKLFIYFAAISLLLSCLGLFGITSLLIEQKTKIIGIRRVMGASVKQMAAWLIKDYLLLVLLAGTLALPLGYYIMTLQLESFAYRIQFSLFYFILPVLAGLFIAFGSIIVKIWQAARVNPVEALKYE